MTRSSVWPEINDARAGNQPYPVVATTAVEQGIEQITAVDHRVRVAEAFAERVLDRDIGNHLVTDEIHQDEAIDKNRAIENSVAYPQHIERLEGIRCELDTGANLAELARLFEHGRRNARLRQRKRSRGGCRCHHRRSGCRCYDCSGLASRVR